MSDRTIKWAEKRLGRPLDTYHDAAGERRIRLSRDDIRKLTEGPSPRRLALFLISGFAASQAVILLARWLVG